MTQRCPPTQQKEAGVGTAPCSGRTGSGQGVSVGRGCWEALQISQAGLQDPQGVVLPKPTIPGPSPATSCFLIRSTHLSPIAYCLLSCRSRLVLVSSSREPAQRTCESLSNAPDPSISSYPVVALGSPLGVLPYAAARAHHDPPAPLALVALPAQVSPDGTISDPEHRCLSCFQALISGHMPSCPLADSVSSFRAPQSLLPPGSLLSLPLHAQPHLAASS